jgi:hypothetical protein
VTIARLDKNREAIVRFKQYCARALFGSAAGKPFEDFNQLLTRISVSAKMLIMTAGAEKPPPLTTKWHADIWEGYGDAEDQAQIELNRISGASKRSASRFCPQEHPL